MEKGQQWDSGAKLWRAGAEEWQGGRRQAILLNPLLCEEGKEGCHVLWLEQLEGTVFVASAWLALRKGRAASERPVHGKLVRFWQKLPWVNLEVQWWW